MANTSDHSGHVHESHLDLLPTDSAGNAAMATHVAISDGSWFDAATWESGSVPDEGALVHIPKDISVSYDGDSELSLFIVRIDGNLTFEATNGGTTKMIVDTMITSVGSTLKIDADAWTDGIVDIVFAEGAPSQHQDHYSDHVAGNGVNGRWSWDPEQLSLGLVAMGTVDIKGQRVDASLQLLEGVDAGTTQLVFESSIDEAGWQVGQKIVVGGTSYLGRNADLSLQTEDEVREIAAIEMIDDRLVVTIDQPLEFDHAGPLHPETGQELTAHVGNLSRNVTLSSAAADRNGDGLAERATSLSDSLETGGHYVSERGHVMFMHNDDVSVSDTSFFGLGRTDKSTDIDDVQKTGDKQWRLLRDVDGDGLYDHGEEELVETDPVTMTNPRGRYALHLHEAKIAHREQCDQGVIGPCPATGDPICHCKDPSADQDGDGIPNGEDPNFFDGAYLSGNVIWGSPGWGLVQHSSDAVLKGNLAYDVAGSSFVSELGDEAGRWEGNLAIGTYGVREVHSNEDDGNLNEDGGASGNGFYIKSRVLEVVDNVAHSSARAGFMYKNSGAGLRDTAATDLDDVSVIAQGRASVETEDIPIRDFEGNKVIAAREGIRIVTDPHDSVRKFNDAWSKMKDFIGWELDEAGVSITYSSKYLFEDFTILGTAQKVSDDAKQASAGFFFKSAVADITVLNSHVESFQNAVTNWTLIGDRQEYRRGHWDPKDPDDSGLAPLTKGMGAVGGIGNVAHNLWNTNIVGLTYDDISGVAVRSPQFTVETAPGETQEQRGILYLNNDDLLDPQAEIQIELLGDSRDGGLVALWRENLATDTDPVGVLANHMPLAYQDNVYLGQIMFEDGTLINRHTFLQHEQGINADIWSGTILEFAKQDSLGSHVFLYGDFSPLDPNSAERTVTTNERLVFSREMIDGILIKDGYKTLSDADIKFVVVRVAFSDRLTAEISERDILIALDTAWEMPEGARDGGILLITDDMIVAPRYNLFSNGVLDASRPAIALDAMVSGGSFTTDQADTLRLTAASDSVNGGAGDDIVRGFASADYLDGGDDNDALFGGAGWDRLNGNDGDDLLDGHLQRDFLFGGAGEDQLQGGGGRDVLDGGSGHDKILAGSGEDNVVGGVGDDILDGGNGKDLIDGGEGVDQISGGNGFDELRGGAGDDVIAGNAGNDQLFGGGGSDLMNGGARADLLYGGDGSDMLMGDAGADRLYGETGSDTLSGGMGVDKLFGGDGDDLLVGDSGKDRLVGGAGDDRLVGGRMDDNLTGNSGADTFVFEKDSGQDLITDFEDGVDAIEFMIESFGFRDLTILQQDQDAIVSHSGGSVRLVSVDSELITEQDISFLDS